MMADDDKLLERPIFVIGAPRSGTTWIGQVLARHPMLAYLEEPRLTWKIGNDRKSDMLSATDARPEVKAAIRRSFAEQIRAEGKSRLVEKTPSNALRPAFVDAVFPDCLFIHVMRHPYDSVLSIRKFWTKHTHGVPMNRIWMRLNEINLRRVPHYAGEVARRMAPRRKGSGRPAGVWGPRLPGLDELVRDLDLIEVCCLQWRMCVEATCMFGRSLPSDRYMEFRLETMTSETIDQIFSFTGLDPDAGVKEFFAGRFDQSMTSARQQSADEAELRQIDRWVAPTLKWLGW